MDGLSTGDTMFSLTGRGGSSGPDFVASAAVAAVVATQTYLRVNEASVKRNSSRYDKYCRESICML